MSEADIRPLTPYVVHTDDKGLRIALVARVKDGVVTVALRLGATVRGYARQTRTVRPVDVRRVATPREVAVGMVIH